MTEFLPIGKATVYANYRRSQYLRSEQHKHDKQHKQLLTVYIVVFAIVIITLVYHVLYLYNFIPQSFPTINSVDNIVQISTDALDINTPTTSSFPLWQQVLLIIILLIIAIIILYKLFTKFDPPNTSSTEWTRFNYKTTGSKVNQLWFNEKK